ncbi:3-carboxy-cis,cis-muconate cycloisomerase [Okibacterium endophyticum]
MAEEAGPGGARGPGDPLQAVDWGLLEPLRAAEQGRLIGDDAVLDAMVDVEKALVSAWIATGFAPAEVRDSVARLSADDLDRHEMASSNRLNGNPVIAVVAGLRRAVDDDEARHWIHRGATSQDIVDSALVLVASRVSARIVSALGEAGDNLVALAEAHRRTPGVGRTLTQHASPTTFGAVASSWLDGVRASLEQLALTSFPAQLAGSVGNGAAFAAFSGDAGAHARLRAVLCERLGLDDPGRGWHTERSPLIAIASAMADAAGVAGRIGADLAVLARTEIGEVSESLDGGGGSSAMPQKQNPVTAVLLVAAARRASGALAEVHRAMVAEDQRPAGSWHTEWQAFRSLLALALECADAVRDLTGRLRVDTERMRRNLDSTNGLVFSELTGAVLTRELGRAQSAQIVKDAVALTTSEGTPFEDAVRLLLPAGAPEDLVTPAALLGIVFTVSDDLVDRSVTRFTGIRTPAQSIRRPTGPTGPTGPTDREEAR